jgi:hypothetical protein
VSFGLEVEPQAVGDVLLVFNDENAAHAGTRDPGSGIRFMRRDEAVRE